MGGTEPWLGAVAHLCCLEHDACPFWFHLEMALQNVTQLPCSASPLTGPFLGIVLVLDKGASSEVTKPAPSPKPAPNNLSSQASWTSSQSFPVS